MKTRPDLGDRAPPQTSAGFFWNPVHGGDVARMDFKRGENEDLFLEKAAC